MTFIQTVAFTGTPEDITELIRVQGGATITWSRGKDQVRQFSPPRIGTEAFRLHNASRRFSPGNTGSDLFGLVKPNKEVKLSIEESGTEPFEFMDGELFEFMDGEPCESFPIPGFDLFTGLTDAFGHNPAIGEVSVDVSCLDMLIRLADKEISTAMYTVIRIDEALEVILDAVNWPADKRLLDVATVTLDLWWMAKGDVFAEILRLIATEGALATFYCDESGNFVFKNNVALTSESVSTTSQATFSDTVNVITEGYDDQFKNVILAAQVTQQEREAQGIDVVWSYEGDLILGPNESITLIVSNSDPFFNIQEPSVVGINAEQLLIPSTPLTSGTFIANVNGTDTSAVNWNDSTPTIQGIFDTAVGAGNTFLTGTLATGLRVRFIGDLASQAIPLITIKSSLNPGSTTAQLECQYDGDGTNGRWKLYAPLPLSAGTFRLRSINGNTTTPIDFDESDTIVETRLVALPLIGPGDVTVSGGNIDTDVLTVDFDPSFGVAALSVTDATSLRTATGPTADIIVSDTVRGNGPDVHISAGDATFEFPLRESGADVPMSVTAGASGATLMNLHVRAQVMKIVRTNEVTYPESTSLPDGQIYKPTIISEIPLAVARALVFDLYARYHLSRPTENIVIYTDITNLTLYAILRLGLGYRVTVIGAQNGINEDFFIQQMTHEIDWNFKLLKSTFGLEKAA